MNEDNKMKQLLFSIALARKAGKVVVGTDSVCDEIRKNRIITVLFANDISDNTKKKITDCCTYYRVAVQSCGLTKDELGHAIGKSFAACIGITDENLSLLINRNLIN